MTITAPFRFARINRKIWFPDWAEQASHDVPFADGLCGTIQLNINTVTPLLVGGKHEKGEPGTIHPFVDDAGHWAIPGSSLQGVIRQILEVAAFGKLGPVVHDRRFGVRDISPGVTAAQIYRTRTTQGGGAKPIEPLVRSAWLVKRGGRPSLVRCDHGRIAFADIAKNRFPDDATRRDGLTHLLARTGIYENLTKDERSLDRKAQERLQKQRESLSKNADSRYAALLGGMGIDDGLSIKVEKLLADRNDGEDNWPHSPGLIHYKRFQLANAANAIGATLVLTGKPVAGNGERRKHREFVFYAPNRAEASERNVDLSIPDSVWRDFLLIHAPEKGSGGTKNPNWEFWEPEFKAGRPVPVFFIEEDAAVSALGMAQMFKLAMQLSTHQMLENSSADHVNRTRLDLPALIFGATGDGSASKDNWYAHNLKRRAAFDLFRGNQRIEAREKETAGFAQTLLSPKPSFYPIYVRQAAAPAGNRPYAAYHRMEGQADPSLKYPELSGVKVWPSSRQTRLVAANGQASLSNHLRSVPAGQEFSGALRVHNLRPVELGALLWALSFGEPGLYLHRLGGAKPLGFGAVEISIKSLDLIPNDPQCQTVPDTQMLMQAFTDAMESFYGKGWAQSPQVLALRRAAKPEDIGFNYPKDHTGYKNARDNNEIMEGYADSNAELVRDLAALRAAQAAAQQERLAIQPHLRFAALVQAHYPNRQEPPTEFPGHPETDAFAIGDRVQLNGGTAAVIVAYPSLRAHPAKPGKTKWVVGYENAGGTLIVEERKQADIQKI